MYLPVNNENQIEIKSKNQIAINSEIFEIVQPPIKSSAHSKQNSSNLSSSIIKI
jgi:hypothetical protein